MKAPMNADTTPMAAVKAFEFVRTTPAWARSAIKGLALSAVIGVESAFIGASQDFLPHHSLPPYA
jgi:hypothetical protein